MEERIGIKTPTEEVRETLCVARVENLIASIPLAILIELPVVDVPVTVVGVPVDIHGEDLCILNHPFHHPLNTLGVVSYSGHKSPRAQDTNAFYFLKIKWHAR